MRSLLKNYSSTDLIALGYGLYVPSNGNQTVNYLSGGPGYVMSNAAFKKFVEDGLDPVKRICRRESTGNEDVNVGKSFFEELGLVVLVN